MREDYVWVGIGSIWVFGWAILSLVYIQLKARRRLRERELLHRERLAAIEKGATWPEIPEEPERLAALESRDQGLLLSRLTLLLGLLGIGTGLGISLAFLFSGDPPDRSGWSLGLIPVGTGLGFLVFALRFSRRPGR
jgi:hypothetical protein